MRLPSTLVKVFLSPHIRIHKCHLNFIVQVAFLLTFRTPYFAIKGFPSLSTNTVRPDPILGEIASKYCTPVSVSVMRCVSTEPCIFNCSVLNLLSLAIMKYLHLFIVKFYWQTYYNTCQVHLSTLKFHQNIMNHFG